MAKKKKKNTNNNNNHNDDDDDNKKSTTATTSNPKSTTTASSASVVVADATKTTSDKSSSSPSPPDVKIVKFNDLPTKEDVQNLFHLWNDALATLDSDVVAQRYAEDAILLPTVSDFVRTDYKSIKSYFDLFLQQKPQGKVLESYVTMGKGW
jgi:hypothetical protein